VGSQSLRNERGSSGMSWTGHAPFNGQEPTGMTG
jgi:hypothetical protein